jgi:hypothetical protein
MVRFHAHPLPPSSVSKLDRRHTGRLRKRDNLLPGEEGGGSWATRKKALPSINDSILSASVPPWKCLYRSYTVVTRITLGCGKLIGGCTTVSLLHVSIAHSAHCFRYQLFIEGVCGGGAHVFSVKSESGFINLLSL